MTWPKPINSPKPPKSLENGLLQLGQRPGDLAAFKAWSALHPAKTLAGWFDRPTGDITGAIPPFPARTAHSSHTCIGLISTEPPHRIEADLFSAPEIPAIQLFDFYLLNNYIENTRIAAKSALFAI
jgi:hypothetical protein